MRRPLAVADIAIIPRIASQREKGRCIANWINREGERVTLFGTSGLRSNLNPRVHRDDSLCGPAIPCKLTGVLHVDLETAQSHRPFQHDNIKPMTTGLSRPLTPRSPRARIVRGCTRCG